MNKKQSGFTLIELIIVIALILFSSAIAIPGFISWIPNYRLRAASQDLLSNFQKAKIEAVKRNINAAIVFPGTGYTVFIDQDADFQQDAGETVVATVNWADYPGINNSANSIDSTGPSGNPCIAFLPNSMPAVFAGLANGTVALTNVNGRIANVVVTIAGSVTINTILP